MPRALNKQKLEFCKHYAMTRNASKSAIAAGYSAKSAAVIGCTLLKDERIKGEIERLGAKVQKKNELTVERVMQELCNLVTFDPASLYDSDGNLLKVTEMPEETRKAIAGIEHNKAFTKLRLSSKLGAVELASKVLGMLRAEQSSTKAVQIIIQQPPEQRVIEPNPVQLAPDWGDDD